MLPTELGTPKLSVAKARPECLLGIALVATQLARTLSSYGSIEFHASTSTLLRVFPLPLSLEGEGISF